MLPTGARPSGGLRGSCPGLVIRPPIPFQGRKGRPTGEAAPIGNAGLEPIGPPAGDLGPVTACPAGPAPATRAEAGRAWLQGLGRRRVRAAAGPPRPVRPGTCRGSIRSTAGTSAPTAPSRRPDRRAASAGSRAVARGRGFKSRPRYQGQRPFLEQRGPLACGLLTDLLTRPGRMPSCQVCVLSPESTSRAPEVIHSRVVDLGTAGPCLGA